MDQRVRVDHLQRAGGVHDVRGVFGFGGDGRRSRDAEDGTDALAAGEEAVAHGAMNRGWMRGFGRGEAIERGIDAALLFGEKFLKGH